MRTAKQSQRYDRYDIFISYRREGGWQSAKYLEDILTRKGYRVFLDISALKRGDFWKNLRTVIENCKDFIIVMSPGCLDSCTDEKDWVRQELACALKNQKNVIPFFLGQFQFPAELPEDIDRVRFMHGIYSDVQFFQEAVKKLITFLNSKPVWWRRPLPIAAVICVPCAVCFCIFALIRWGLPFTHEPSPPHGIERTLEMETAVVGEVHGSISAKEQLTAIETEGPETIASSGRKAVSYLSVRTDEGCPLSIYDPEGPQEAGNERLYDNAMAAAALIAYHTGNKNHSESELIRILDSISETVGNMQSTETMGGIRGVAAASIVLLKYDHDQKNFAYARAAQAALDRVLEECRSESGGFTEGSGSESRLTVSNIWLYAAFDMLHEKTRNSVYRDASRDAEVFAQSMRSSDGKYFLAGDFSDIQRDRMAVCIDPQALAALVMNDRSGLDKAMDLRRNDGSFPTDESSADMMNTESTALMAAALGGAGQEEDKTAALSAIYRYQKNSGGIPESDREGIADSSDKKLTTAVRTSSTAWYALACMEYDLFRY